MRIGARQQVDFSARDVEKTQRVAARQLLRLVGAHDVVRDGRNIGGHVRERSQRSKRKNGCHETHNYSGTPNYRFAWYRPCFDERGGLRMMQFANRRNYSCIVFLAAIWW